MKPSNHEKKMAAQTLAALAFDAQHLWHPYSALPASNPALLVESARGCTLQLANGKVLIDAMASWWSVVHGYNHPQINAAMQHQIERVSHVMFGGLTHAPAIELAQRLVRITPERLDKVFLADSGSIAVEVALKMAVQYWRSLPRPQPQKTTFLTLRSGYHGDTIGAMALCDPDNGMHQLFAGWLHQNKFANAPTAREKSAWSHARADDADIRDFEAKIAQNHRQLAAVILEPVCQGAGGMRFYSPTFLQHVRAQCDQYGVLLIFDEIATGFGRTGKMFALEHGTFDGSDIVVPDILCVGKALTGGYISLAATLTTASVSDVISHCGRGALMHGPTFMGNPLACAAANASLELLAGNHWQSQVKTIEQQMSTALRPLAALHSVASVRILGAIGVVEMVNPVDMRRATRHFVAQGVWLRPFGKLIYLMPPYIISTAELRSVTHAIRSYCEQLDLSA